MDKFLTSYMQSMTNIDTLKKRNLINENRKILYDPEYKDKTKTGKFYSEGINYKKLTNFIMKRNLSQNLNCLEKDYKKEFLTKKMETKYYLPGINGIPEYIVYLNKDERKKILNGKLPPLKTQRKELKKENREEISLKPNFNENVKEKKVNVPGNKNVLNDEQNGNDKKEEKIDTDKYIEIEFEKTQLEAENN